MTRTNRILLAWTLSVAALVAETLVLENFTLIDGNGGPPIANAAIVITDGRIKWAGPKAGLKSPAGSERRDLSGKFIMPGIINLHSHLGNGVDLTQDPKNFTSENLARQLALYASYGVTSTVSMGSDQDLIFAVRAAQRIGRPRETRIFTAGRGFTGPAGYPTSAPGMKGVPYEVSSVEEVRKNVADLAAKKVDLVKIWVDDHLGKERKIPMDLSKAIIAEATRRKIKVAAHVFYLDDSKALVKAGLRALAHSVRDKDVDDELISAMKSSGAYQIATLTREISTFFFAKPGELVNDPYFTRGLSPSVATLLKTPDFQKRMLADPDYPHGAEWLAMARKNLKKLSDAGVKIGFGTDTGPPRRFQGFFEQWEMELMVEAGMTPMQVITSASKTAAEYLGESKNLGTLQAGKWADLIVLGRNPLENIRNTRSIETVLIAGNKAY